MQITAPFGYKRIAPLRRDQKVRLPPAGEVPDFARTLNAIPISFTEFAPASRDYPIAFTSGGIDKLEVYRRLGVQEVWYWRKGRIQPYVLRGEAYEPLGARDPWFVIDREDDDALHF